MKRLNLGSGRYKKEGYVNVDWDDKTNPDVLHNLNIFPYPFKDNEFDMVEADHVLEHLDNPFKVVEEFFRILKPKGKVIIHVPHFSRGFTHAEHKRGFDVGFPLYFDPDFTGGYKGVEFKLERMKLNWFGQPYLKKATLPKHQYYIGLTISKIINFLANLSPYACSRIWCFWVGGFDEIEFVLRK